MQDSHRFFSKSQSKEAIKKFISKEDNLEMTPVSSLEEVAIHLRTNDEDHQYQHFLLQVKLNNGNNTSAQSTPSFNPPPYPTEKNKMSSETQMNSVPQPQTQVQSQQSKSGASVAKAEKEDIQFLVDNAEVLMKAGELELARNIFRALLKTSECSDVAYAGLAMCADQEGLVEQAIQYAWDSVAFAPNKKGYQILAQLLVQQGRDQEAAQALSRALKALELTIQEKGDYYKMIGNCMSRLGQTTESERAYKKALEMSPASDEVQSNLGSLYLEQGKFPEAKRCYQDAIASNTHNDKAWVGLGLCCVADGDKESAHEAFARSLDKNIRNSTAIFHLVKCAYEIKKYSTAEKILSQYVEIAPVSASLLYSLAGLQFHVGKKREASLTAKRILQIKSDHQGARDLIRRIDAE